MEKIKTQTEKVSGRFGAALAMMAAGPADAQFFKKMKESWNNYQNEKSGTTSQSSSSQRSTSSAKERKPAEESKPKGWLEKMREWGELKRPNLDVKPLPETEAGWTKVRSNVVAGFKCDHYEKGDKALRVLWKDNGDFITVDEDPDGLAREPKVHEGYVGDTTGICPYGPWRVHLKHKGQDVVLIGGYPDGKGKGYTIMYSSGNGVGGYLREQPIGYMLNDPENMAINWEIFKTGKKPEPKYLRTHDWLYLSSNPEERYPSYGSSFLVGNRAYDYDKQTLSLTRPTGQYVDGFIYPIVAGDTIVSIEVLDTEHTPQYARDKGFKCEKLTYANGDYVLTDIRAGSESVNRGSNTNYISGDVYSGTLHRAGGVLKIKDRNRFLLTFPDGKLFGGRLALESCTPGEPLRSGDRNATDDGGGNARLILGSELKPWTGDYELPDGTIEHLEMGLSSKQLAEANAMKGPFDPSDPKSLALLKKRAEGNDPDANLAMAVIYYSGWGVQKNVAQAMKYLDKAKSLHGESLLRGVILYEGAPGVTKNQAAAFKELEQSASWLYYLGDSKQSLRALLEKSGDKYTETITNKACRYLGICYEKGIGVTGNLDYALSNWIKNSTDAESMYKMGYYTEQMRYKPLFVRGVKKPNYNVAREFYRIATDLGHAQAKAALQRLGN